MIVLDASVCAPGFLADEHHPVSNLAEEAFRQHGAVCPAHLPFEMGNLLLSAVRRGRLDSGGYREALRRIETLPILIEAGPDLAAVADIAVEHGLTFYDAGYLETAMRRKASLGTLDKALMRAAKAERVPLVE